MAYRGRRAILLTALLVIATTGTILGVRGSRETTLVFQLQDAVSKGWVWDATVTLQDRSMHVYYQSNTGPVPLEFTRLDRGRHSLEVAAPHYQPKRVVIDLRPGRNVIDEPIELQGTEIPDLADFALSVRTGRDLLNLQLRPIARNGAAIVNHPALDLALGVIVSEHINVSGEQVRGTTLFAGLVDWIWEDEPGAAFRYTASLPLNQLSGGRSAEMLVLESVVVVEDYSDGDSDDLLALTEYIETAGDDIQDLAQRLSEIKGVDVFFPAPVWGIER